MNLIHLNYFIFSVNNELAKSQKLNNSISPVVEAVLNLLITITTLFANQKNLNSKNISTPLQQIQTERR